MKPGVETVKSSVIRGKIRTMSKSTIRCRIFGHKWRAYALDMPVFRYYCVRCQAMKSKRMPWEPIDPNWDDR